MGSPTTDGALEELLAPVVSASGLELDSVTRTRSNAMPLLRVVVEAPIGAEGIDSDTLADVSRAISKTLDVADPIDGEYLLEVSTPSPRSGIGCDRLDVSCVSSCAPVGMCRVALLPRTRRE